MRRVDVALLFENAPREIEIACALKYILARRHGLTMEILQQNNARHRIVRDIKPTVVVLPYCYHERSNNRFLVGWHDATFFNLTWEQLFYPGNAAAKTPRGEFAVRHVIHNAWSEAYADVLRAQGVPEQNIFVSGNPAYTLYDEPYRRYYKSRATLASENGLDAQRRWVYFPENYNWAFYGPAMLDADDLGWPGGRAGVCDARPGHRLVRSRDALVRDPRRARRHGGHHPARARRPTPDVFRQRVADVLSGTPAADLDRPERHGPRLGPCQRRRRVVVQHDDDRGERGRETRVHGRTGRPSGVPPPGVAFARPAAADGGRVHRRHDRPVHRSRRGPQSLGAQLADVEGRLDPAHRRSSGRDLPPRGAGPRARPVAERHLARPTSHPASSPVRAPAACCAAAPRQARIGAMDHEERCGRWARCRTASGAGSPCSMATSPRSGTQGRPGLGRATCDPATSGRSS